MVEDTAPERGQATPLHTQQRQLGVCHYFSLLLKSFILLMHIFCSTTPTDGTETTVPAAFSVPTNHSSSLRIVRQDDGQGETRNVLLSDGQIPGQPQVSRKVALLLQQIERDKLMQREAEEHRTPGVGAGADTTMGEPEVPSHAGMARFLSPSRLPVLLCIIFFFNASQYCFVSLSHTHTLSLFTLGRR